MSTPGPDEARRRSVRRGAFPVRRTDLEQAEPFVPGPAEEDQVADGVDAEPDERDQPEPTGDDRRPTGRRQDPGGADRR